MEPTNTPKLIAVIVCLAGIAVGVTGLLVGGSLQMMVGFATAILAGIFAIRPHLVTTPPSPSAVATPDRRRVTGVLLIVLGIAMIAFGAYGLTLVLSGIGVIVVLLGISYARTRTIHT